MPIVFLTAYYGLVDLAELKRGERVLIHAGAGGVGMAAIQLAQHLGAEVFATASPAKWEVLRGLGLDDDHIASSRDLEFGQVPGAPADGRRRGPQLPGGGVRRRLAGAAAARAAASWRWARPTSASPSRSPPSTPASPTAPSTCSRPAPTGSPAMLAEIVGLFARGALRHPPISTWDVRRGPEAFRHLREASNVGKVVLTVPAARSTPTAPS